MNKYHHIPVLLQEVLHIVSPAPGQHIVDATLGGGGYTDAIAGRVMPHGAVLSIDLDTDALKAYESGGKHKNVRLVHGNFSDIGAIVMRHDFGPVDAIVADIGLSSYELDQAGRGISFQKDEPLDMRFDVSGGRPTAGFMLAEYNEDQLTDIFLHFGEEHFSKLIARNIVRNRAIEPIVTTRDLVNVITASVPGRFRHKANDSVRRIFQSLRIAVNGELENLERFLPDALEILSPGGILAVVSFHSLEDRIVKQFFADASRGCICPKDFPVCICGRMPAGQVITRRPIVAGASEVSQNSRSKPAKLRAIKKV